MVKTQKKSNISPLRLITSVTYISSKKWGRNRLQISLSKKEDSCDSVPLNGTDFLLTPKHKINGSLGYSNMGYIKAFYFYLFAQLKNFILEKIHRKKEFQI